ncbi:hypothetical protein QBC46DRAFT_46060 [Diplogelasinospora grovesii]|uniref:Uncharacterized protein n=1 Tax=Diplogelasinospora grovesii TaxID=303347 RepID=A0AAN6N0H8_9PEZI|nr:hypothetical protein QBC46DRAFT_46060 [Diplogelasinospora grovesii]
MSWTPITPRGRGAKKKAWKPPDPKRRAELMEKSKAKKQKTRSKLAPIERLPTEILQRIFLLSENLSFPRSSLHVGLLLSPKSFLTELVVYAFSPTWDVWFGCPVEGVVSYTGWHEDETRIGGDLTLQSDVLASPWANLSIILDAQRRWYRRHGAGRYFQHSRFQTLRLPEWEKWRSMFEEHPRDGFGHAADVTTCFERDWKWFKSIVTLEGVTLEGISTRPVRTGYIDMHPSARIPNRLITGPLDWEQAKLLYWFARGGARMNGIHQSWEVTSEAYDRIMDLPDEHLRITFLNLFEMLGAFADWPPSLWCEKVSLVYKRDGHSGHTDDNPTVRFLEHVSL